MADAVVNILFQNLNDFLIQEASLLSGVHGKFRQIKRELASMRAFLRDADRSQQSKEGLRTWVEQVRDVAYDVEDVIDEFKYHMQKSQRGRFKRILLDTICLPKNIWYKHQFATRLQELASDIASISEGKDKYDLSNTEGPSSNSANERMQRHGETSFFINDDESVGLKRKIDQLVRWLTEEEPRRTAISVVGMGGLGKTTLVAQVYKNQTIKQHFNYSVWVSVSQSYNIEALLKSMITDLFRANMVQVPSDLDSMNRQQLLRTTNEYLDAKKYIVILDDVWSIDAWNELKFAFPRNTCGSRIMITTRHEYVASALGDGSRMYQLKPLSEGEAWDLFSKNAFWKEPCPQELRPLAKRIVQKCGGLPLAIVALSRLMSLKQNTMLDWNLVYDNLSKHLSSNQLVKCVLLLSFYDLPYRLKHCFLYCCVFPEDYLLHRKQLIKLLVAEGFVEDGGKITMEEEADEYLKELVHRNMLQVVGRNDFGTVRTYRVHDVMRDVALSLSNEENFCHMIHDGQQARKDGKVRRMSIYNYEEIPQSSSMSMLPHLRSLLVFDKSTSFSSSLNSMASGFRLLRVLNLEGVPIEKVPDELSTLFNLRYLNLRKTRVRELPESLGRLQNLQTLDLRDIMIERLPKSIIKLRKLRHLYIYRVTDMALKSFVYFSGAKVSLGEYNMTSLQTLTSIEAEDGKMVKQVGNLTQLRKLSITKVKAIHGEELCMSVGKMKHLLCLIVQAINEEELLELEALSPNPPPLLRRLVLIGRLEKVPRWLSSLTNLTNLSLQWSWLREEEDPLPSLQGLPNLVYVNLSKAYQGQMLRFDNGWFPKLKILRLYNLPELNQLVIEQGAMPCIQKLRPRNCRELKMVPRGIEYLTGLQELFLREMPVEFVEKLRVEEGNEEHRQKVGHIPRISHVFEIKEGQWVTERLN